MTERELFEGKFGKPPHWVDFDEVKNKYECKYNSIDYHLMLYNARWEAWQASANRQGYKLVPVEPTKEMLERVETEKEYFFHVSSDYCDLGIPSETVSEIYKAMIGAVE